MGRRDGMKTEEKWGKSVCVCGRLGWAGAGRGVMLPAATVMHKDESTGANVAPTNQSDNGWRAQLSWQFLNCDGKPANMQLFELQVGKRIGGGAASGGATTIIRF